MRRVFANLAWLLGGRGINALLSLVYLGLVTRSLGIADFGRFTLIVVMAQMLAGLASFSTWQAVVRWGAIPGSAGLAAGFAVALDLTSLIVGAPLVMAAAWTAPLWLPLTEDLRPLCLAMGLGSLLTLRSTPTGILRLHDRYGLAAAAESTLPAARVTGAALAWAFAPDIAGFIAAWIVAEMACATAHWWLALRAQPLRRADISLTRLPRSHAGAWRFVWSTNLSRSLAVTSRQALHLLVGSFGGPALAGGFRLAAQLGTALVQLGEAVSRALYPELVRAGTQASKLAGKMACLAALGGALATALALAFGEHALVMLAGPDFAMAATALAILAAAGSMELLASSWDSLLVAKGRAGTALALRAVPAGLGMAALAPAISGYGLAGAAACVAMSSALATAGLGYAARSRGLVR